MRRFSIREIKLFTLGMKESQQFDRIVESVERRKQNHGNPAIESLSCFASRTALGSSEHASACYGHSVDGVK